ncbi:UDP-N-acetylglucosamine 4-epimerase [Cnuella takakiae]|uniref:UDP-N-acetylglucosamine 4-epimerase n=1 Tax=Cnuella takakiae TaxID=1302690 RepID=A0A1M5DR47_9BACT|nr:SDR family oxidoreductase [Cnuella takakiae]OLY93899.1 LPS biosynthesis protein WbpP [Cnuella takakiae]SHF69395.1 UDP-N-acetylglucosamine 4-epimerase [Cnuella takakiae]
MKILLTGGAGFIGSHLAHALIERPDVALVQVLDNLSTGSRDNIADLEGDPRFRFVEGDIRDWDTCRSACTGMDLVCHQAGLGSVPRSIKDPLTSNEVNIGGTLQIFEAARQAGIRRVVYASSSSVFGDHPALPKVEEQTGSPLTPYAVTKLVAELYAGVFALNYGMEFIGLRYFNVFGPRQNPDGPYAAVVPRFVDAVLSNEPPLINGDGLYSRDFTFVGNAVEANLLALTTTNPEALNQVYNIGVGQRACLNDLLETIKELAGSDLVPQYGPVRPGDVAHSLADIGKAGRLLGYRPTVNLREGLKITLEWYRRHHRFGYA